VLVAEFGSRYNGIQDMYSDKDLLIVGTEWSNITEYSLRYELSGYSVSPFLESRALYLSSQGSLFFKHIINESSVICDKHKFLKKIKNTWEPRHNYNSEIESNIELLELLKYKPKTIHSLNFVNDLLIISIRNILIRKIAEQGQYVFGWDQIFKTSVRLGFLKERDIEVLKISKKLKNAYRSNVYLNISGSFIDEVLNIGSYILNQKLKIGRENEKQVLKSPETYQENSYKQLRALEFLCSHYSFDKSLSGYIKLIKKPNYTCSTKSLTSAST